MRVLGCMVVKNEADRYLEACLAWASTFLDDIFLYDDRSDDNTAELARQLGCTVTVRPEGKAAFLEHEGRCRQDGWQEFERVLTPDTNDLVLVFDADEFLVSTEPDLRKVLRLTGTTMALLDEAGMTLPIPEVFGVTEQEGLLVAPQVRIDGWWGGIKGQRLFRYQPNGVFRQRAMASGSAPLYVSEGRNVDSENFSLLHYGYANRTDLQDKFDRYMSHSDGHSNQHVQSIVSQPLTEPWRGPVCPVWRGSRV